MIATLCIGAALAQVAAPPSREQQLLDTHNRQADSFTPVPDPRFQLGEGLTQVFDSGGSVVGEVLVSGTSPRSEVWVMSQNPANIGGLSFALTDPGLSYVLWPKPVYPDPFWTKMCETVGTMPPVVAPALALGGQTISRKTYDLVIDGAVYGQLLRETQKVNNVVQRYADYWVYYDGYNDLVQDGKTLTVTQIFPGYGATGAYLDDNNFPGVHYSKVKWMWAEDEQFVCIP